MDPYWPADPVDLEREYSPSSRAGGSAEPFVADYEARSAAAASLLRDRLEVLVDGGRAVPGEPGAPLLVFVHGGYWQALGAESSTYLAPGALAMGWSYAALEYTIAPAADLETMVDECRRGLAAVVAAVERRVGSIGSVVLAGHSAGAHLAAMVALAAVPPVPVRRVVLVSGVFDLRPIVATSVNDALGLDTARAAALSPMLLPVASTCADGSTDVVVTWGDHDTEAFAAQSRAYASVLRAAGADVAELECAGRHHFDIVDDVVDPHRDLGALVVRG